MSDIQFCEGAIADLTAVSAVPVIAAVPAGSAASDFPAPDSPAPRHCGVAMEWRAPDPVAVSVYSFDAEAPKLPPVWCCRCGFQLDGVVRLPVALTELSR
jgi:hypothetical protein